MKQFILSIIIALGICTNVWADADEWAIQQIKAFKKNHDYGDYFTQMWVISSCDKFSENAQNQALASNIRLINGLEFAKMILDTGLKGFTL